MARNRQRQSADHWRLICFVALVAFIATWVFISPTVLEEAFFNEQENMEQWVDPKTAVWIKDNAFSSVSVIAKMFDNFVSRLDDFSVERWLAERLYVAVVWAAIIAYRLFSLAVWIFVSSPIIAGAFFDGYYLREIRKMTFVSQSPIRHRLGVSLLYIAIISLIVWMVLPITIPVITAPIIVLLMALSLWMWIGNLQKRL